jgi:hypothetical protein
MENKIDMNKIDKLESLNKYAQGKVSSSFWNPDWNDKEQLKFYIMYDHLNRRFLVSQDIDIQMPGVVYMPKDIAQEIYNSLDRHNANIDNLNMVLVDMSNGRFGKVGSDDPAIAVRLAKLRAIL